MQRVRFDSRFAPRLPSFPSAERRVGLSTMCARPLALPRKLFASADFAELTLIQCPFRGRSQNRAVLRTAAKPQPRRVSVESVRAVTIGDLTCGRGQPLLWIAGPCVIEAHDLTLRIAERLRDLAERLALPLVFKASFDKANRTSNKSFR